MRNIFSRRWLRFSVRTLLVAVTIFCVWLGWQVNWVRERRIARQRISFANQWIMRNGTTYHDGRALGFISFYVGMQRKAPWSLRIFGEQGETHWILDMPNEGSDIESIRTLFPEVTIVGKLRT